uniref:GST_C_6 domain-containing protein n=1 Tax=Parastrongyloides trichosuri TaxID=131310 RepID=A0A0N4Z7M9_PARTI
MAKEYLSGKSAVPWNDAKIYGLYPNSQGMISDNAEVFATVMLLKIEGLPFRFEGRPNAENMSKNGRTPILRLNNDNHIICGFQYIYDFLVQRGLGLTDTIPDNQIADHEAYLALIDETLRNVELWMCWKEDDVYYKITKERYGSVYSTPLNYILPCLKRREISRYFNSIGWGSKTVDDIIKIADNCFQSLSIKLGDNEFFFGDKPTHLDAFAFGHLYCIITTVLPNNSLVATIKKYENLQKFCQNMEKKFIKSKIDYHF